MSDKSQINKQKEDKQTKHPLQHHAQHNYNQHRPHLKFSVSLEAHQN